MNELRQINSAPRPIFNILSHLAQKKNFRENEIKKWITKGYCTIGRLITRHFNRQHHRHFCRFEFSPKKGGLKFLDFQGFSDFQSEAITGLLVSLLLTSNFVYNPSCSCFDLKLGYPSQEISFCVTLSFSSSLLC